MGFNLLLPEGETQEVVVKAVQNPEGLEEDLFLSKGAVKHQYVGQAIIHLHPRDTFSIAD